jgi:hypothetical protein
MIDNTAVLEHLDDENPPLADFAMSFASRIARREPQFPFDHLDHLRGRPLAQARLLQAVSDLPAAWAKASQLGEAVERAYWESFSIFGRGSFTLVDEASRELLNHGRPAAALDLMQLYLHGDQHRPNPHYVVEGLKALGTAEEDLGRLSSYEIKTLIEYLHQSDVDEDEVALLEWKVLPALGFEPQGLFLERRLARDPAFFVEIISLCFRPKNADRTSDIPQNVAANAYRLIRSWQTIPGTRRRGEPVDLNALRDWYATASQQLTEADRLDVGQRVIGQVLAHAPGDNDGLWPCQPVRSFIEQAASKNIETGFLIECINKRGIVRRSLDEGGAQERALASQYAEWAGHMATTAPRTAATLRSLAEQYTADGQREDQEARRHLEGFED